VGSFVGAIWELYGSFLGLRVPGSQGIRLPCKESLAKASSSEELCTFRFRSSTILCKVVQKIQTHVKQYKKQKHKNITKNGAIWLELGD